MGIHLSYPKFKATDSNGKPLAGGKLYTYIPGTTTDKNAYSDYNYVTQHSVPIVLDSAGEATVYLPGPYKLVLKDSNDVEQWTMGNIGGIDSQLGNVYYPYHGATDQGATGDSDTIKYAVDTLSTDTGTIKLLHNSGSAATTYTLTTSAIIPSNVRLIIEEGAKLDGAGTLTLDSPDQISVGKKQNIFGTSITVTFTNPGYVYPDWWSINTTPGTTDMYAALNSAEASLSNGGKIVANGEIYACNTSLTIGSDILVDLSLEGSQIAPANAMTITFNSTDNVICYPHQDIFSGSGTIAYTNVNDNPYYYTNKEEPGTGNQTITATMIVNSGLIDDDPEGNANWTTDTAANIVAAISEPVVGMTFHVCFHNDATAASAEVVTIVAGAGVTLHGTTTLTEGTNETAILVFRLTNVTAASEAVDVYIIGG